ncbi:hypothetical protein T05_11705 [Trichinella murrelli]|uniref:Uncharacterized protein n=1 Tax=Trichinella murrelli TaxID=144512 RepID=A0A0V0SSV6_9BILA|nr:hypothetical protein T05_11705 [Trichinella murrelli]
MIEAAVVVIMSSYAPCTLSDYQNSVELMQKK